MTEIYDYKDYKSYLIDFIKHSAIKGMHAKLAMAARCQRAYFSRVMKTHSNLSLEQGLGIARFLGLGGLEADFFLDLIAYEKTSDAALKARFAEKLEETRKESFNLKKRFAASASLDERTQNLYYSSWHWSAIHIIVSIPDYRTTSSIARRLGLPEAIVSETLNRLKEMKLVSHSKGEWRFDSGQLHLAKDSIMSVMNHANWRHRAILDSQNPFANSLHYTAVHSHSFELSSTMKTLLMSTIDESRSLVAPSRDEELSCLSIDWFKI